METIKRECSILDDKLGKQEKIQLVLQTLNSVNQILKLIPQVDQEDLDNWEITEFQKKYLFAITSVVEKNLSKVKTLNIKK